MRFAWNAKDRSYKGGLGFRVCLAIRRVFIRQSAFVFLVAISNLPVGSKRIAKPQFRDGIRWNPDMYVVSATRTVRWKTFDEKHTVLPWIF